MAIVATEIESIHGRRGQRMIFYKCQDHLGAWHPYGPVFADETFDQEAHKTIVAVKVANTLAINELDGSIQ